MRTIHFKNGKTKKISQTMTNSIKDSILSEKTLFQIFSIGEKKNYKDTILIINISEINYID